MPQPNALLAMPCWLRFCRREGLKFCSHRLNASCQTGAAGWLLVRGQCLHAICGVSEVSRLKKHTEVFTTATAVSHLMLHSDRC